MESYQIEMRAKEILFESPASIKRKSKSRFNKLWRQEWNFLGKFCFSSLLSSLWWKH